MVRGASHLLGILKRGSAKWLLYGTCVGVICGIAGTAFHFAVDLVAWAALDSLAGYQAPAPAGEHRLIQNHGEVTFRPWLLPLIMVAGALVSGWLVFRFAPEAKGAGTEAAIDAYHNRRGRIPLRASFTKFFASVATLGTGGSAGREGPIAMVGAGFGSWLGARLHLSGRDRRILLAAGLGGGVAAIFRAPLAGALFAAEVLYSDAEMEADTIIPAFISSIVGYVVFGLLEGAIHHAAGHGGHAEVLVSSLFQTPEGLAFQMGDVLQLAGYLLIALAVCLVARVHIKAVRTGEQLFGKVPLPLWLRPALGALLAGLFAMLLLVITSFTGLAAMGIPSEGVLAVLGAGYGILQTVMMVDDPTAVARWAAVVMLLLVAGGKIITTVCTVCSGGSGGLFGPSIVIGGCVGGAVGFALQGLPIAPHPAACVIMGMAGFFTTAYRTPIAALLMVSELTGSYFLLLPSMWVCALCFLINGRWSIVSTQVPSPVDSAAHLGHFFNDILAGIKVEDVFDGKRPCRTLRPESSIDDCKRLVTESHQTVYPVVEENGRLCGIFNMNDLRGFLYDETLGLVAVADDVATKDIIVIRPRDTLASAMRRFTLKNLEELPVVETTEDGGYRFLGLITRREVIGYYNQTVDELRQQRRDEGYDQAGETSGSQRRPSVRVRSSETQHDDD